MDRSTYERQYLEFVRRSADVGAQLAAPGAELYPCLEDDTSLTGFDRHYVYHPAWAARILAQDPPDLHVDISSTLHFCTMLSAFIPVDFYDYRPADLQLDGLRSLRGDLLDLPFEDQSVQSISCMHTLEHIGLARYGDPLDPLGDRRAMAELQRVVAPGGRLLVVMPVGRPRVMFNAHRIYDARDVPGFFPELELTEFALIPEDGRPSGLMRSVPTSAAAGQEYGCGCFCFTRR